MSALGRLDEIVTSGVAIGDLDGDGQNEALVLEFFQDPQNPVYGGGRTLLTALDNAGHPRWKWEAPRFFSSGRQYDEAALPKRPAVHLLRVARQAAPLVCLNLWGNGSDQVLAEEGPLDDSTAAAALVAVFDGNGRPLSRIPVNGTAEFAAWPLDADGDGSDELAILSRKDRLRLVRPGAKNDILWRQDVGRSSLDAIAGIVPPSKNGAATIIVRESERLTGFAADDGRLVWRISPPRPRQGRNSLVVESIPLAPGMVTQPEDRLPVSTGNAPVNSPRNAFAIAYRYGDVTLAARALSTGGERLPSPRVMAVTTPGRDSRWTRPLPWADFMDLNSPGEARRAVFTLAYMVMLCVTLLFLPGWYMGSLLRRRAWSLKTLFVAPALVGLALVALSAPAPFRVESASLVQKLLMGFSMLPVVLLVFAACRGAQRRRWRRLAAWVGIALATSVGIAALMITVDQFITSDALPYSWEGWPGILLMGVYCTGWLLIPASIGEWAVQRINQSARGGRVR
jgi:hypothetical protein